LVTISGETIFNLIDNKALIFDRFVTVADAVVVLLACNLTVWNAGSVVVAIVVLARIDWDTLEAISGVARFTFANVVEHVADKA